MDATSPPEPRVGGRFGAAVFALTLLLLGPWGYLAWGWLADDVPTTWWRGVGLILLPVPMTLCLLLAALRARPLSQVGPNSPTHADAGAEAELERVLRGRKFYTRQVSELGETWTEIGSLGDLNQLVDELEAAEALEASDEAPPTPAPPMRPVLYMFQHVALRDGAFQNYPTLIEELSGPPLSVQPLMHSRRVARYACEDYGLLPEDYDADGGAAGADHELLERVRVRSVRRGGYTAHVVTMPPPEHGGEAYMTAIVLKDDERQESAGQLPSTRYFTLERSRVSDRPMLCEWRRDGSRENSGEGPDPEVGLFADAVFDRIGVAATGRAEPDAPEAGPGP